MRQKTLKVVVTFPTNSAALAMEAAAASFGIPGRTIPVPSAVSAGCGLSWCVLPEQREELLAQMEQHDLEYEGIHEVMLY